ncbi:sensor histidine kinase [uncultured Massilia sp.]|uniref:sensor histidine kinase n=1 Tax=uncultured Massilia sp. TaxID=169973 RepID=UPI0025EE83FA|nr:ATP-binding protein [uncultured Massilia sp.]
MPRRQDQAARTAQSAALILLTVAIFAIDAFTRLDTAIAVMYIVVLMLASPIWSGRATRLLGAGCILLTLGAYLIAHGLHMVGSPAGRALVSIAAIAIATWLAVQRQEAMDGLRKRQDALRRSEAFLSGAQRLTRTGSFGVGVPDGAMVWSEEAARIFGYGPDVPASMDRVIERTLPEDRAAVRAAYARALACDGAIDFAHRLMLPGGAVRHVHVLAEASTDQDGDCEYLGAITDITERVEAEQQLHASQIQLAHAARVSMLGELAASVAHEVNQPMTAIVANAKAARRWLGRAEPDLPEALAALDGIVQASERAGQVIRRIRALARRADPEHRPLDVNALVQETLDLLQRELARLPLDLRVDLAPGLPEVVGDRVELQQVLINLVMNALQAMGAAGGPARLDVRTQLDGGTVRLAVRDSGPGIADSDSHRLFEPFFSTKADGMGLGLSICRSIITKHGGQIGARSTPPGSTFHIELPVLQEIHT